MVTVDPVGERPREDLTTAARIRDAAMVEFADKGYRAATMRSIAAAAGVSVGLIQHHFGTKEGLREACDDLVLGLVRVKAEALDHGTLGDRQVLGSLMAVGPRVQRYLARALVDGSGTIAGLVEQVMDASEAYLSSRWPDRFVPGSERTRDAAAALTAINTSTMVMQSHVARRMQVEPFTEAALQRIGVAMFDAFEAIGDLVDSKMWRDLRAAVDALGGDHD